MSLDPTPYRSGEYEHNPWVIMSYRRLRSLSTCAYRSNSADMGDYKRAVLSVEVTLIPSKVTPPARVPCTLPRIGRQTPASVKKKLGDGLDLG